MFFMCGIDSTAVPLEISERAAPSDTDIKILTPKIMDIQGVEACLLLSTCNRTELYIPGKDADISAAFELVLPQNEIYRTYLKGEDVISHIFETACGLNSLIKRETHIISQLTYAEQRGRELNSLNASLEVLMRLAVTAAKKAVGIAVTNAELSSAQLAADWLEEQYSGLSGKKILVTGNGNVGRLATKSPHFTYKEDKMLFYPDYFIDLAVPRDISQALRERYGKNYRCIDDFVTYSADNTKVFEIIEDGIKKYYAWETYRNIIPVIDELKEIMTKRLCASDGYDEYEIGDIVSKTTDMLLCSLKENLTDENMKKSLEKLTGRARL